ncbi:hypothetical protein [Streptomyces platensis]|uniref:hypothetical protein n=1 Tax=Streptomyces platensis TaxID=58346 RepID=UPI001F441C37|nr:hypothetical protein [Streptomyces platensis]MCF3145428.1 hypothetical protein [Streptomyces platensis]
MCRTPLWVVTVVCAIAAGPLLEGAVAQITDLLRHGLQGCDRAPGWLNSYGSYWSSPALLAPLAAAPLISGKGWGTDLACAIILRRHDDRPGRPGLKRVVRMIFR